MVFKLNRQKENMDIGIILSIAIMWPFTTVHCRRPCALNKMVDVRGLYQQNIDLVCKHSPNCTRVFWKRHQDVGRPEPISNRCEECVYKVTNNAVDGTSILHIQNLSGNVKGVYTCYCNFVVRNSTLLTRSTEACYNLTIDTLECGMKASIKGQRTLTYNGNHLGHIAETLDANINDVLSVSCLNDEQKETNCSELARLLPPITTLMDAYSTSTISTLHSTPNFSTGDNQVINSFTELSKEVYTTKIMTTLPELKQLLSTINLYSEDKQSTYKPESTSQHLTTDTLITTPGALSTAENQSNTILDHSIFQDKMLFSFVIALTLTSTIIILQSVFIIIFTRKRCVVLSSQKEKWINPIYDSSVNNRTAAYAETEILGGGRYSMTPHDQSLPCLNVVGIQEKGKFHSVGSLYITENKDHLCFTEKYKHGKARNNQGEGVVSYLNANLDKKLDSPVNLTKNISDIESDSFSSDEEETSHSSNRFKVRKERFTSLHIYEDANNGGTS